MMRKTNASHGTCHYTLGALVTYRITGEGVRGGRGGDKRTILLKSSSKQYELIRYNLSYWNPVPLMECKTIFSHETFPRVKKTRVNVR